MRSSLTLSVESTMAASWFLLFLLIVGMAGFENVDAVLLDKEDAIYNAYTSKFTGSKNVSATPRVTEDHFVEEGFLSGVGNVTNKQTYENTYLSDDLAIGKGNGTFETADGQRINWISTDLGSLTKNEWLFHGVIFFNNTQFDQLSLLNHSIGLYKSTPDEPRIIWLLEWQTPSSNSELG